MKMAPIRTSQAWLGARWTLMTQRNWKDRGEGPVSYLAVLMLVALIAVAIIGSGIDTTIKDGILNAVKKVTGAGTAP
jgi:hypothetical protein